MSLWPSNFMILRCIILDRYIILITSILGTITFFNVMNCMIHWNRRIFFNSLVHISLFWISCCYIILHFLMKKKCLGIWWKLLLSPQLNKIYDVYILQRIIVWGNETPKMLNKYIILFLYIFNVFEFNWINS